jgi:mannose-6-phosphate isomerase-like protein (cupin superfamily)
MRRFVTGVNAAGRSCFVEEGEVVAGDLAGPGQPHMALLWATGDGPPPPGPSQSGHRTPNLVPGAVRWLLVEHPPGAADALATARERLHHQDALDLLVILSGSTRMVLEDDERDLEVGDCVVMNGVDHVSVPGPDGCRMLVVSVGTPPPG